jgi:PIN like domain
VRLLFDNCTSPALAATFDGFLGHLGHRAFHLKDLPCGRHASDLEWIALLSNDASNWIVITGDARIQKNRAERLAYRQANLRGFVLAAAYQKTPLHQVASFLLWRWPDMLKVSLLLDPPFLFELPMSRHGKLRQLPL